MGGDPDGGKQGQTPRNKNIQELKDVQLMLEFKRGNAQ